MASQYVIQVVDTETGKVVQWAPGMAVERQLVSDLCGRVQGKGVGFMKREAQVIAAVRSALTELLFDLKSDVNPGR